jgi:hypothetical protein
MKNVSMELKIIAKLQRAEGNLWWLMEIICHRVLWFVSTRKLAVGGYISARVKSCCDRGSDNGSGVKLIGFCFLIENR